MLRLPVQARIPTPRTPTIFGYSGLSTDPLFPDLITKRYSKNSPIHRPRGEPEPSYETYSDARVELCQNGCYASAFPR
ncbi:jg6766 [Pararge aegeria aegeria]|uniref:Jg6766 protein n=1 Tax=Pararge aegeria aegeria TaxID=348720 RepID=A0A8S4QH18_9NEOP|nr:jg6766 [Pararge aegeria aegeria]